MWLVCNKKPIWLQSTALYNGFWVMVFDIYVDHYLMTNKKTKNFI